MAVLKPDVAAVRAVITTSLEDDAIEVLIDDAALIAERCLTPLEAERQERILVYLVAHLISTTIASKGRGRIVSDRLGDAARSYATTGFGKQLDSTSYGQTALLLDPNGCLARLGRARASIEKV